MTATGSVLSLIFLIVSFAAGEDTLVARSTLCLGRCIAKGTPCFSFHRSLDCGVEHVCCMDEVEPETESNFDWTSLATETIPTSTRYFADDLTTTEVYSTSENLDHFSYDSSGSCPGVCIRDDQSSLCQYPLKISSLCDGGKTCCATKDAARDIQNTYASSSEQTSIVEEECPGKCVDPSLVHALCNRIIPGYSCPMNSKCCDEVAEQIVSESPLQCTGECLTPQYTYLCLPPFSLVPATMECLGSTVCCMKTEKEPDLRAEMMEENSSQLRGILESLSEEGPAGGVLASDENGQIYYVFQNGQFRPLKLISFEESVGGTYAHYADVQVEAGRVSLFRDIDGVLYQLYMTDSSGPSLTVSKNFKNQNAYSVEDPQNTVVSLPDDGDDVQESFKDLVLPEEGEDVAQDSIPPGERTLIKPPCPGNCISSMLRFTCNGNHTVYDGFTCTSRSVCCADLKDVEDHENYLKSLSPYFKELVNPSKDGKCGIKGEAPPHKGKDCTIGEWCWQAAIVNSLNQYICGATVIDSSWILTAAHCVTSYLRQDQVIYVRAGVADLASAADNKVAQTRRALSVFIHHDHNGLTLDNDIALLKLSSPFSMNVNVCSICLPASGMPPEDSKCTVTGYGFVNAGGKFSLKLEESTVPLVDDLDCIANVTDALSTVFILPANSFCAGGHERGESCQGDAGGPLVCQSKDRYELVGLVSWGLGCSKDLPSVYVKIPSYLSWINQIMSANTFLRALG